VSSSAKVREKSGDAYSLGPGPICKNKIGGGFLHHLDKLGSVRLHRSMNLRQSHSQIADGDLGQEKRFASDFCAAR